MKIWLYTVTRNEAKIMPFFLRHYEQFCDRITVFDDKSDDGTREIVRAAGKADRQVCPTGCTVVLEDYPYASGLDDREFIQLATDAYKRARGHADWVIWVDSDEFLYHPQLLATLEGFLKAGVQVPLTRGFQMISEKFPDPPGKEICGCGGLCDSGHPCPMACQAGGIVDQITEGVEDPLYAKPCIFRPECEMHWDPGKHYVHGNFNRGPAPVLKVLHYRCLGMDYLRERHARNFARCSQANIASGLGVGVYPGHQGHMSEPWFNAILPTRRPVLGNATFYELVRVIHQGELPIADCRLPIGEPLFQPTWGSEHPWLHETIERVKPQVLIEVGSFLGRSAAHMGGKLKELGMDSAIICVDTFLGDDEHWTIPEVRELMGMDGGRPMLYQKFKYNMRASGMDKVVIPLPIDSISGARLLSKLGVKADLIYIDGGHVEGEVYRDLVNYWSLLRPGGAMLADDYGDPRFAGLQRDIERFIRERNIRAEFNGNKARLWF